MAVIKAFECIRPDEKVADRVAGLPFYVYKKEVIIMMYTTERKR